MRDKGPGSKPGLRETRNSTASPPEEPAWVRGQLNLKTPLSIPSSGRSGTYLPAFEPLSRLPLRSSASPGGTLSLNAECPPPEPPDRRLPRPAPTVPPGHPSGGPRPPGVGAILPFQTEDLVLPGSDLLQAPGFELEVGGVCTQVLAGFGEEMVRLSENGRRPIQRRVQPGELVQAIPEGRSLIGKGVFPP